MISIRKDWKHIFSSTSKQGRLQDEASGTLITARNLIYGAHWRGSWYRAGVAIRWIEFHAGVSDAPAC